MNWWFFTWNSSHITLATRYSGSFSWIARPDRFDRFGQSKIRFFSCGLSLRTSPAIFAWWMAFCKAIPMMWLLHQWAAALLSWPAFSSSTGLAPCALRCHNFGWISLANLRQISSCTRDESQVSWYHLVRAGESWLNRAIDHQGLRCVRLCAR